MTKNTLNIIFLNNEGLSSLQAGRHEEAITAFRAALQEISGQTHPMQGQESGSKSQVAPPSLAGIVCTSVPILHHMEMSSSSVLLHSSAFGMHRVNPDNADSRCNTLNTEQLGAALIYNLGFTSHIQALSQGMKDRDLRHAMKMYTMACQLVQRGMNDTGDAFAHTLLLRIYNNKAHISSQFFDATACSSCLNVLRWFLYQCDLEEQDADTVDLIMANVVCLERQVSASAPAA